MEWSSYSIKYLLVLLYHAITLSLASVTLEGLSGDSVVDISGRSVPQIRCRWSKNEADLEFGDFFSIQKRNSDWQWVDVFRYGESRSQYQAMSIDSNTADISIEFAGRWENNGTYQCFAFRRDRGTDESADFHAFYQENIRKTQLEYWVPSQSPDWQIASNHNTKVEIEAKDSVKLRCTVSGGNPRPERLNFQSSDGYDFSTLPVKAQNYTEAMDLEGSGIAFKHIYNTVLEKTVLPEAEFNSHGVSCLAEQPTLTHGAKKESRSHSLFFNVLYDPQIECQPERVNWQYKKDSYGQFPSRHSVDCIFSGNPKPAHGKMELLQSADGTKYLPVSGSPRILEEKEFETTIRFTFVPDENTLNYKVLATVTGNDVFKIYRLTERPRDIRDTDNDGLFDTIDDDDDNDGFADKPDPDENNDGLEDDFTPKHADWLTADQDGDGIADWNDDDADGDGVQDALQRGEDTLPDSDGDQIPDWKDVDDDGDGILDVDDLDDNGDGVEDTMERDTDGDGVPDRMDADDDNDGQPDGFRHNSRDGYDQDDDNDGILNDNELNLDRGRDALIDDHDIDIDGDGAPNHEELDELRDTDDDGRPDIDDNDDDNDGILDINDDDIDGDGILNVDEVDSDKDGILDDADWDANGNGVVDWNADETDMAMKKDTDKDGIPDIIDNDKDGDGKLDIKGYNHVTSATAVAQECRSFGCGCSSLTLSVLHIFIVILYKFC